MPEIKYLTAKELAQKLAISVRKLNRIFLEMNYRRVGGKMSPEEVADIEKRLHRHNLKKLRASAEKTKNESTNQRIDESTNRRIDDG